VYLVVALFISYFLDTCIIKLFALTPSKKAMVVLLKQLFVLIQLTLIFVFCQRRNAATKACTIWLAHIQAGQAGAANPIQWTFKGIVNNYCNTTAYKQIRAIRILILNRLLHERDSVRSKMHHLPSP
jgi:hypothetical protein